MSYARWVVSLFMIISGARQAAACDCKPSPPPAEAAAAAAAVFTGAVAEVRHEAGRLRVTLDAARAGKGVAETRVVVHTSAAGASCGFAFERGRSYLVYAYREPDGSFSTNLCTRTRPTADAKDDLAALGEGQPVPKKD